MKILLLGATGLVGNKVLDLLLADPQVSKVNVLSRRPTGNVDPKLEEFIGSLHEMDNSPQAFAVDAVLCCLGTTIKKAGSQEKFKLVDYEFPLQAAQIAKEKGVEKFAVITALGSNADSKIFYNKVKGELERDLIQLGLKNLFIIRPSIIVGERKESRPGEAIGIVAAKLLSPLFIGPLKKYGGSKVSDIAHLMISLVKGDHFASSIEFASFP